MEWEATRAEVIRAAGELDPPGFASLVRSERFRDRVTFEELDYGEVYVGFLDSEGRLAADGIYQPGPGRFFAS